MLFLHGDGPGRQVLFALISEELERGQKVRMLSEFFCACRQIRIGTPVS